jgi:N-carbamoyl-L-amino-acid hydrolase
MTDRARPHQARATRDALAAAEGTGFDRMWRELAPIGRAETGGGYRRFAWQPADLETRAWFGEQAARRGMPCETDRNGNLWARWQVGSGPAVVTGSHLDSVPDGGAFDGPLGVVSAFAAVDLLRERGVEPARPIVVACFTDEEGARFGVACAGSRLATGQLSADRARELRDADGVRMADAMTRAGQDPDTLGPDPDRLADMAAFVELHVEQGRALADLDAPIALGASIWPHGRWRFDFGGEPNHAGTTRLEDRRDPMLTYATTVLDARKRARLAGALATFGRVEVAPNGTNAIPRRVRAWLDARAADEATLDAVLEAIETASRARASRDGTSVDVTSESRTARVEFAAPLRERVAAALRPTLGAVPVLPTGAGHDAGILAASVPTAMLFVRNPTGVSHAPAEHAETGDCLTGVVALADTLAALSGAAAGAAEPA